MFYFDRASNTRKPFNLLKLVMKSRIVWSCSKIRLAHAWMISAHSVSVRSLKMSENWTLTARTRTYTHFHCSNICCRSDRHEGAQLFSIKHLITDIHIYFHIISYLLLHMFISVTRIVG